MQVLTTGPSGGPLNGSDGGWGVVTGLELAEVELPPVPVDGGH